MPEVGVATIRLSPPELLGFYEAAQKIKHGVIQLGQECNTVNAKSWIDLFTLDFTKNITLVIHSSIADEYIKLFDRWKVKREDLNETRQA